MSITVEKLARDLNLEVLVDGCRQREVKISDINRPGLQFAGYYDYFAHLRIQILGLNEWSFLNTMQPEVRRERLERFFEFDMPCIIISRGLEPHPELLECAEKKNIWVFRQNMITTRLVSRIMNYLDRQLAEKTTIHGVLVSVYGVGILITGESGIGKSEAALELIKRGHIMVTDDVAEITCVDGILYGTSPYITSGMLEVRGMGIIDISALYGLSSILEEKSIDMVIELEQWDNAKDYDRLGLDDLAAEILGVKLKKLQIPIRPGRNIAVIVEAAAANFRYNLMSKESPVDKIDRRMEEAKMCHESLGE